MGADRTEEHAEAEVAAIESDWQGDGGDKQRSRGASPDSTREWENAELAFIPRPRGAAPKHKEWDTSIGKP